MAKDFWRYPADGTGKRQSTRVRVVGANTVHEPYTIALPTDRILTTRYSFWTTSLVVGASADASNVGRVYIENDQSSPVLICLRRASFRSQHASVLATPTAPRLVLRRFTFTGTAPSGAVVAGAKADSLLANKSADWDVRTATTGMSAIAEVADIASFYPTAALTAVGAAPPSAEVWYPTADETHVLRAGEGIMVKQADAGTASDTRVFQFGFLIDEYIEET
jgi:hypothetical protein